MEVPMPRDLSEEAVAEWLFDAYRGRLPDTGAYQSVQWDPVARAVRALVSAKVREAVMETAVIAGFDAIREDRLNAIVARVLGEEAPRG